MPSNFNITLQFLRLDIDAQAWVQFLIWSLIKVLYIFKITFASLEIRFLDIHYRQKRIIIKANSICYCLPPDTTWHKVKSPKAD